METDLPSGGFAMAVFGCRSLMLVIIQPSTKIAVINFVTKGAHVNLTNV